jgi:hypothetical protein
MDSLPLRQPGAPVNEIHFDNFVPGISVGPKYAGLVAPRPCFAESGDQDSIFPIEARRESVKQVRQIYEVVGAADRINTKCFPADHSFWGNGGFLSWSNTSSARPTFKCSASSAGRGVADRRFTELDDR